MFKKYPLSIIYHFFKLKLKDIFFPGSFISEDNINPDPMKQFDVWYKDALKSNATFKDAVNISTADRDGKPSGRMVLLKAYDENGFVFFGNSNSRKGKELSSNPFAALTFFWDRAGKQVRAEGRTELLPAKDCDEYFSTRPRLSQLGAWASEQSSVIPDRKFLLDKVDSFDKIYKGKTIPRPPYWTGYRFIPEKIEFWQSRSNRLHDRILFSKDLNNNWSFVRLSP
jgi:pyridoxamine 5'-phosphate oxidase